MKKNRCLRLLLCAALLLQIMAVPVQALPVEVVPETVPQNTATQETTPVQSTPGFTATSDIPFGSVSIQSGCRTIEGMVPLGGSERRLETAQSAFAFEVTTGTVIYSYSPDVKVSPGTLTKIVTALVAIENCNLKDMVTVKDGIQSRVPMGARVMKPDSLKSGEQLTVEDLLHGVLLTSANDAAVALAEHVSGSTTGFLTLMNQRVRQMGCYNTEFGNISGLDTATSYTTARDMARIVMEACKNDTFVKIFGTIEYTVPETNMAKERELTTDNYFIDESVIPQFLDQKVKGGLASYSEASGASIACLSQSMDESMTVVTVVLGSQRVYEENGWKVKTYGNFNEMQTLIAYVYDNFKVNRILYENQALEQFTVMDGECDVVGEPHVNYNTVLPKDCTMTNLIFEYTPVGGGLSAPIKEDQMIATVAVKYRNSCIAEAEIYAMGDVSSVSNSDVNIQSKAAQQQANLDGILGIIGIAAVLLVGAFGIYIGWNALRRARVRALRRRRRKNRRRNH